MGKLMSHIVYMYNSLFNLMYTPCLCTYRFGDGA